MSASEVEKKAKKQLQDDIMARKDLNEDEKQKEIEKILKHVVEKQMNEKA